MKLKSKIKIGRGCTRYFSNLFIYDWNLYFKVCRTINRPKLPHIYTYGYVTLFQQLQKLNIHDFCLNPFVSYRPFLYPLKKSENLTVSRGQRKGALRTNGLESKFLPWPFQTSSLFPTTKKQTRHWKTLETNLVLYKRLEFRLDNYKLNSERIF